MMEFERQDSRKRRRLSERRQVFSRIGLNARRQTTGVGGGGGGSLSSDKSWSSSSQQQQPFNTHHQTMDHLMRQQSNSSRSDSPSAEASKISMKIQFHITVAPDHEPLILDTSSLASCIVPPTPAATSTPSTPLARKKSVESIGDQIHERLTRQNTLSTRRRQQLLAMHNRAALDSPEAGAPRGRANSARCDDSPRIQLDTSLGPFRTASTGAEEVGGREAGARASTITDGMSDEATLRFLARHQTPAPRLNARTPTMDHHQATGGRPNTEREHIYFKRDGQRFGHEFTLKLAVDRTYRCLLKVRPLIPLQSISIQGHHVLFADCSQSSSGAAASANSMAPSSAPASSLGLNRSWQDIRNQRHPHHHPHTTSNHHHHHRLHHAQTTSNLSSRASLTPLNTTAAISNGGSSSSRVGFLYQQQQNQMMRYFAASHCSSTSNSHLGSQLIYMFDWSANRFEVNKNKARTEIQTVLKFKNGQILSLPLQVKFYQSECRQHLSWGSQLHFIDYECNINSLGQISVERVQYY